MQPAKVLGTTHATAKHPSLVGQKLLIVQPLLADGGPDGPPLLTVDAWGASRGDRVLITSDGAHTRELIGPDSKTPARWSTLGIIDD